MIELTSHGWHCSVVKVEQLDRSVAKAYPDQVLDVLPGMAPPAGDLISLEELYPDLNK